MSAISKITKRQKEILALLKVHRRSFLYRSPYEIHYRIGGVSSVPGLIGMRVNASTAEAVKPFLQYSIAEYKWRWVDDRK